MSSPRLLNDWGMAAVEGEKEAVGAETLKMKMPAS